MDIKQIAKAVVAIAAFVGVVAAQVADGTIDIDAIVTAGIALLGALGVWAVPNKPKPASAPGDVVASTED